MKNKIIWSAEESAAVQAALPQAATMLAGQSYGKQFNLAQDLAKIPADRRKTVLGASCTPWANRAKYKNQKTSGAKLPKTAPAARPPAAPISKPCHPKPVEGSPLSLDDAIEALCDVLVARVHAVLSPKLETVLAQRVAASAIKLAPPPSPRIATVKVDLEKPETLDDATLRIELIKAIATGDQARRAKLVLVRRKRDEAANSISFHSAENA